MIHPTALVSAQAVIGAGVSIGPYSIVHDNVILGDRTTVGGYCELGVQSGLSDGSPLRIGSDGLIRSHSIFYEGSVFGDRLVTGHRVTVREMTRVGINFQVGTLSDIQGHCTIGDYARFHSNVHIGQKSTLGDFVWIFPYVVLTNDPHPPSETMTGCIVEDYAAIATMSIVLPGVRIGRGALVGAHSSVNRDVAPDTVVAGSPAKMVCLTDRIKLKSDPTVSAYPWRRHFHRGYPKDVTDRWKAEFAC